MHAHEHRHTHIQDGAASSKSKLKGVSLINVSGFLVELLGGLLFGSVALLSDSIHMLFDASAYLTAFVASYVAEEYEPTEYWTFGFHRLEVIAALINGILLIPIAFWIVWTAYQRFLNPVTINLFWTLLIGIGGLALNLISVLYLHDTRELSLNERGAFYHLLGDAAGSIAVIVGVGVIHTTDLLIVDPLIAVFIAILVLWSSIRILVEGVDIILQRSPVSASEIQKEVESITGVESASNIKSWKVCSQLTVCTLHAKMQVETLEEAEKVRKEIAKRLKEKWGIQEITIQME